MKEEDENGILAIAHELVPKVFPDEFGTKGSCNPHGVGQYSDGIDQRKIHMLAREHLPTAGYTAPVCIHTPILNGLDGKKMSSSSGNYISVADSVEEIEKKCQKAFCPPECEENPVLQILQYHVFPRMGTVTVKRPAKFGGDREFASYPEIETAYRNGEIHPLDLKRTVGIAMAEILSCVRDYIT
ncbi:MAG: hypothetical protein HGA40_01730 [Methanoregulaceae archaeon]|nr:hypothetical protein [Methanoregulaceae archaeon]